MRRISHVLRDISYSIPASAQSGRVVIRATEKLAGRVELIKRVYGT
ncbi:hypothetical protein [uncultured Roseovarius sp.]|nr:hypothetical protein [uncultured Roseovarius sp.]